MLFESQKTAVKSRSPYFKIFLTIVEALSNHRRGGTRPKCSKIVRSPSKRHSWFSPLNNWKYPALLARKKD